MLCVDYGGATGATEISHSDGSHDLLRCPVHRFGASCCDRGRDSGASCCPRGRDVYGGLNDI